ncbi:MAG TPA: DUF5667 domain-containing protein [Methanoregula sp.]|nr:DUF5667 domain-containing protein [Methanoregula sp.]
MKNRHIILAGIIIIALLCSAGTVAALEDTTADAPNTDVVSDDIAPYHGPIGADSPLFGLKVAMEDLDETFTFNDTQRVEKQIDHARLRIAEVRRELELNRTKNAERALEMYWQKLNLTEGTLTRFGQNETGLLHAQEMIVRHQTVLANLLFLYPDSTNLAHAYNNNLELEQKFGEKTQMRFDRFVEKNNKTILKAVKLEIRNQNRAGEDITISVQTMEQDRNETQDRIKDKKNDIMVNATIATQNEHRNDSPSITKKQQEDRGSSQDQGKNGHD